MTVKELIEKLQGFDQSLTVVLDVDDERAYVTKCSQHILGDEELEYIDTDDGIDEDFQFSDCVVLQ